MSEFVSAYTVLQVLSLPPHEVKRLVYFVELFAHDCLSNLWEDLGKTIILCCIWSQRYVRLVCLAVLSSLDDRLWIEPIQVLLVPKHGVAWFFSVRWVSLKREPLPLAWWGAKVILYLFRGGLVVPWGSQYGLLLWFQRLELKCWRLLGIFHGRWGLQTLAASPYTRSCTLLNTLSLMLSIDNGSLRVVIEPAYWAYTFCPLMNR